MLNASAGSWGVGNQAGYVSKFGLFDSDAVILQIGSHDLTQKTSTSEVVGRYTHPSQNPLLATYELLRRYIWPMALKKIKPKPRKKEFSVEELDRRFMENLESLKGIHKLANEKKTPLFVLFTPSRKDLIPDLKEPEYKADFLREMQALQIPVIDTHEEWGELPLEEVDIYFRDKVHLSPEGNEAVADLVFQKLCETDLVETCDILVETVRDF